MTTASLVRAAPRGAAIRAAAPASRSPRLAAIVPATDRPPTLGRCLRAIRRAAAAPEEVIVVDGPPGLSAVEARNSGARRTSAELLVFVDADVEVRPDAFVRLRAAFAGDPRLSAAFGSYDDAVAVPGLVSSFRNLLHHHVHQRSGGAASTFWTGLGAIRREAFLRSGGFDADRFAAPSVEDIDLGMRLAAAGDRLALDPRVQGTHLKRWTLRRMVWTDFARRGVPWVRLQLRARRLTRTLNLGWRHRLSAAACSSGLAAPALGAEIGGLAAVGACSLLLALNASFYLLLARRIGPLGAVAGVALHALHHLTAVAAVAAGVALHAAGGLRGRARALRAGGARPGAAALEPQP